MNDDTLTAALVASRALTDSGRRTTLDVVLERLGFDRAELEVELESDLAAGRE